MRASSLGLAGRLPVPRIIIHIIAPIESGHATRTKYGNN
jgi:hypothetical protein